MTGSADRPELTGEDAALQWYLALRRPAGLGPEDSARFEAWISAEPENRAAFERCTRTWQTLEAATGEPEMLAMRAQALGSVRSHNRRRWASGRDPASWIAAAAAIVLVIGIGAHRWLPHTNTLSTERGERRVVTLADGSRVGLDASSAVNVDLGSRQRRFALEFGRARFDVAQDRTKPFTVEAGHHIIVATGTSFSVEVLNGMLHVIVYEGKVAVLGDEMPDVEKLTAIRDHPGTKGVALTSGQTFVAAASTEAVGYVHPDASGSAGWEDGQLQFVDEPLADVVSRLNRYSPDEIIIADPSIASIKVSGLFNANDNRAFLELIAAAYPIRVDKSDPHEFRLSKRMG